MYWKSKRWQRFQRPPLHMIALQEQMLFWWSFKRYIGPFWIGHDSTLNRFAKVVGIVLCLSRSLCSQGRHGNDNVKG